MWPSPRMGVHPRRWGARASGPAAVLVATRQTFPVTALATGGGTDRAQLSRSLSGNQRKIHMPNAGMTIAYMLISARGATVFFAVSDWPVGVLFDGLRHLLLPLLHDDRCRRGRARARTGPHPHGRLADVPDVRGRGELVPRLPLAGVTRAGGRRRTPAAVRLDGRSARVGDARPAGARAGRRGGAGCGLDREGFHLAGHGHGPGGPDMIAVKRIRLRQ